MTYRAYAKYDDGTKREWKGLRKSQAVWRYHWLDRCYRNELREYGWAKEEYLQGVHEYGWAKEEYPHGL